jgi:hypothetical protein
VLVPLAYPRTLTLLDGEAVGEDKRGNDVRLWTETEVEGCAWWPSSTSEAEPVGADTTTDRFGVLFPEGVAHASGRRPSSVDRVRLPDEDGVWQIDGTPRQHVSPITGSAGGYYGWLQRVTG